MDTPTPSPDHPNWVPPRDPRIAQAAPTVRPNRLPTVRRRHPAAKARRIAGWATVASSAAIVGYMVTANAQQPTSQSVVTSVEQQPSVATPTVPAEASPVVPAQPGRQLQPRQSNSSSHGS